MSVLGHKITDLHELPSLQPSDTFLAIRGGLSYKILGSKFATIEQLNINRNEYTLRINTLDQRVTNDLTRMTTDILVLSSLIGEDYFLKTSGEYLSSAIVTLSSDLAREVRRIDSTYTLSSFVTSTSASIMNYSKSVYITKLSAYDTFIPFPASQYFKDNGKVLTWSSTASAWIPGPGLTVSSNIDLGPIGTIIMHGGSTPPPSYLLCNGQAVKKVEYYDLWQTIGDTYGRPPGTALDEFRLPDLLGMGILTEERAGRAASIPTIFCIKAAMTYRSSLSQELSSYLKLSDDYTPLEEQYLKFRNGEWIPSTLPTTSALPTTAPLSATIMWNGREWIPAAQIQTVYSHQAITAFNNTACVFTNIPTTAKKITIVISGLDITPNNGNFVKIRLGNEAVYVNSGYKNACYGIYANPFIRTSNGYYSYTTNTDPNTDACYLLVRGETLEFREPFGGLDTIITFMRSQLNTINSSSKWVYTHTGRIEASVVHGAGSVSLPTPAPDTIGIFTSNPSALLTTGNLTLYWE